MNMVLADFYVNEFFTREFFCFRKLRTTNKLHELGTNLETGIVGSATQLRTTLLLEKSPSLATWLTHWSIVLFGGSGLPLQEQT